MKKTITVMTLVFFLSISTAAALDVAVSPSSQMVNTRDLATYDLLIANTKNSADKFTISIDGPYEQWIQKGNFILVPLAGASDFRDQVILYPTGDAMGTFEYTLTAQSLVSDAQASATFSLDVGPQGSGVYKVEASQAGTGIQLVITAKSDTAEVVPLTVSIKDGGRVLGQFILNEEVDGVTRIERTITPNNPLSAGTYTVEVVGLGRAATGTLSINTNRKIDITKTLTKGGLYDEVTILVTNNGNVEETNYVLDQTIEGDQLTGFVTKAQKCVTENGDQSCQFVIPSLSPGETAQIVYRIEYWPNFAGFAAGGILVALLLGFGFVNTTRPKISKSASARRNSRQITLNVKGSRFRESKGVVVRDFVNPLAKVDSSSFASMKPVLKRSAAGTEMIWKIGYMKPGEHRILSYKVKPLVDGPIQMPKATMRYSTEKNQRMKSFSKAGAM